MRWLLCALLLTTAAAVDTDKTCASDDCMAAKQVPVALLGVGGVGRALVEALVGARAP